MTTDRPVVLHAGSQDPAAPLVVLLHGRGADEAGIGGLADLLPAGPAYAAVLFGTLPFDAGVPTTPGRLARAQVLVIHGDHDTVIPRELLDRTWAYLQDEAGADTVAVRDPGGHDLSDAAVAALGRWLADVLDDQRATS